MKCPVCSDSRLMMSERQGIEIDCCPNCRGIWLDRGELDKIIERSSSQNRPPEKKFYPQRDSYESNEREHYDYDKKPPYKKKKSPGSFLEDLFDF